MTTLHDLTETENTLLWIRSLLSQSMHPAHDDAGRDACLSEAADCCLALAVEHDKRGDDGLAAIAHDAYRAANYGLAAECRDLIDQYESEV